MAKKIGMRQNLWSTLKDKFTNASPSDIELQDELKNSLDSGKTVTMTNPKSERYTYLPGLAGKALEKFKPQTREEKDTLSPIGFFRQGEIDENRKKIIQERIKSAAQLLGKKEEDLTEDQKELLTAQAQNERMQTQDVPSTAIKKIKYNPDTEELWVTFQGNSKKYWYPRVPKEKVEELMNAPSKGEYFLNNIHDQYSVNYKLHHTHSSERNKESNRHIKRYYNKMQKDYRKVRKTGKL